MEPPPHDGAGHCAAGENDTQTPQGKADVEMEQIGCNSTDGNRAGQTGKTDKYHLSCAKLIDQRTEVHSYQHLHDIAQAAAQRVKAALDSQRFGDGLGVKTAVAAAKAQADKLHEEA